MYQEQGDQAGPSLTIVVAVAVAVVVTVVAQIRGVGNQHLIGLRARANIAWTEYNSHAMNLIHGPKLV